MPPLPLRIQTLVDEGPLFVVSYNFYPLPHIMSPDSITLELRLHHMNLGIYFTP